MLRTPGGKSEVSSTWYRSVAAKGLLSDGTAITEFPMAISGATNLVNPQSGLSSPQITPTTPNGSFNAKTKPCIVVSCTAPSYLSAHAAQRNHSETAFATSDSASSVFNPVIALMRLANSALLCSRFSAM